MRLATIADRLARDGLLLQPLAPAERERTVTGITLDSRQVQPGWIFCALRGHDADGHLYLPDAEARGASAALVETAREGGTLPQLQVGDGRRAAAAAAAAFFRDPWEEMLLIGVTGTNGKTTSVAILRHVLGAQGPAGSVGTLGVVDPEGETLPGTQGLTTPDAVEAARWLRVLADGGARAAAMEVSSHALDQGRLGAVRFDGAVFTNLSRDHLDYHGSLEAYRAAKLRLLELVAPGGVVVVNADDPAWAGVERAGTRRVSFGFGDHAEVRAEEVRAEGSATRWTLVVPGERAEVELPLLGDFNVANALAAAAVLWSLGWGAEAVAERLSTLPQVPGRLERVAAADDRPLVVIDYAHTPDALARALDALRGRTQGRLIAVFGAGGDRDRGKRPEMGRVAAELADFSVLTSDNPRGEDAGAIVTEIEGGMGDAPRMVLLDRAEAIRHAVSTARPGDVVLLAGKGHENYQIWGSEVRPFDERATALAALGEPSR
jgi:UDP-N-acetylmuramoyl-L-alanyl-D-glutamate--2,6-diaminopimelate ligase